MSHPFVRRVLCMGFDFRGPCLPRPLKDGSTTARVDAMPADWQTAACAHSPSASTRCCDVPASNAALRGASTRQEERLRLLLLLGRARPGSVPVQDRLLLACESVLLPFNLHGRGLCGSSAALSAAKTCRPLTALEEYRLSGHDCHQSSGHLACHGLGRPDVPCFSDLRRSGGLTFCLTWLVSLTENNLKTTSRPSRPGSGVASSASPCRAGGADARPTQRLQTPCRKGSVFAMIVSRALWALVPVQIQGFGSLLVPPGHETLSLSKEVSGPTLLLCDVIHPGRLAHGRQVLPETLSKTGLLVLHRSAQGMLFPSEKPCSVCACSNGVMDEVRGRGGQQRGEARPERPHRRRSLSSKAAGATIRSSAATC